MSALLRFAKAYAKLGWAVQAQVENVLSGCEEEEINPNAVDVMRDRLLGPLLELADADESDSLEMEANGMLDAIENWPN